MARVKIHAEQIPIGGISTGQYNQLEATLKAWEQQVRDAVKRSPAGSYELGREQTRAFLQMLGRLGQADIPPAGANGPTKSAAVEWLDRTTLHEADGAISRYVDEIRSSLLYGMKGAVNPTQVAAWLHRATRDAEVNWRTVARTEMVRANAEGRFDACEAQGYDKVWIPPHSNSCASCRRLIENKVFLISELRGVTNYKVPQKDWRPALPQHPLCRHVAVAWVPEVYDEHQRQHAALAENGLDDNALDEMFDSSGQLKAEFENDPRLAAYLDAGKTRDPLEFILAQSIEKTRREEPPGLHHTAARRRCGTCEYLTDGECRRYNWPVDAGEVCASWEPVERQSVGKGFFDNPQQGLDPLLWTSDDELRGGVRDRIVRWWRDTLGKDAPLWSRPYIVGSSTSRAWGGKRSAGDVDVHIVVDYPAFRTYHPEYATLSEPEIYAALVTAVRTPDDEPVEAAPGLPLEGFVCSQGTTEQFAVAVAGNGQGVWDVARGRWLIEPPVVSASEDVTGGEILEGEGGALALAHPEWLELARSLRDALQTILDAGPLDGGEVARLREVYDVVHELRGRAFAPGGGGVEGLGAFVWRYLRDLGPLGRVRRVLNDPGYGRK